MRFIGSDQGEAADLAAGLLQIGHRRLDRAGVAGADPLQQDGSLRAGHGGKGGIVHAHIPCKADSGGTGGKEGLPQRGEGRICPTQWQRGG